MDQSEGSSKDRRDPPEKCDGNRERMPEGMEGDRSEVAEVDNRKEVGQLHWGNETRTRGKLRKLEEMKRAIAEKRAKRLGGYKKKNWRGKDYCW